MLSFNSKDHSYWLFTSDFYNYLLGQFCLLRTNDHLLLKNDAGGHILHWSACHIRLDHATRPPPLILSPTYTNTEQGLGVIFQQQTPPECQALSHCLGGLWHPAQPGPAASAHHSIAAVQTASTQGIHCLGSDLIKTSEHMSWYNSMKGRKISTMHRKISLSLLREEQSSGLTAKHKIVLIWNRK